MTTKEEHNAAAVHLVEAVKRGGGTAERIRRLLVSMTASGETDGPDMAMLFGNADAGNKAALLTLFDGWQRHGMPEALDEWRMRRYQATDAEVERERVAAAEVAAYRAAHGDPSA